MNYNVLAWTWYKIDFKLQQIIQVLIKINWNKVPLSLLTIVTVNCARIRMKVWTVYEIFIQETKKDRYRLIKVVLECWVQTLYAIFLYQIFTFLLNPKEFPMFVLHCQEIEKEIQI